MVDDGMMSSLPPPHHHHDHGHGHDRDRDDDDDGHRQSDVDNHHSHILDAGFHMYRSLDLQLRKD